jgi:Mg-chelatase subunit ChlD
MNATKVFLVLLALGTLAFATSTILIFDDSGSMADTITGSSSTKIDMAKQAGNTFLNNVKAGDEVSLIVFYDCGDIRTEVPFTTDLQPIRDKIASLTPQSSTPIAKAIDYASSYAQSSGRSGAQIILLTDGEETCDSQSDAVTAATNAVANNIKVINVVGLGIDPTSQEATYDTQIATAGKGNYYGANDVGSLTSSLNQAYNGGGGTSSCCPSSFLFPGIVLAAVFYSRKK